MAAESHFIQVVISVCILLFAAKLFAEIFVRLKLPIVLGELLAGMAVGPFAIGSLLTVEGDSLVSLSQEVKILGEIGAIVILFMAGLEMTPREFIKGGKASFTVGTLGVVVPFFVGFVVFQFFGFDAFQAMLVATALTATSIAISVQVLSEFGKLKTTEARLIIGAAVVDDILAIAVLSIVTSFGGAADLSIDVIEITYTIFKVLGFFAVMAVVAIFIIPRIVGSRLWKAGGSIEGIVTAAFFGAAGIAASIGLSPILGSFVVGMALASTKVFERVEHYISKLGLIFAPLFFAIIGAQVDFRGLNFEILMIGGAIIGVAVATKLLGCGLPAWLFLRNGAQARKVGVAMVSRGEVGLIVAGVGISSGVLAQNVYTMIVIMVAVTTIITPIWLKIEYKKEMKQNQS
ncbi:MAG: cation:proton antiporter [Candidatus Nitrosotenuis sp.]|uniref:Putative sodium/hydrogen exchanger n=1 Tax=Candidatus Nitrosotenuis uzonensis TaxID=1407055 RepID=A0A812F4T0_9ARCH|nr:cation:proton antiporter [Candidatus Nitrosotenuis uzonensis]CAE6501957.1 putative sodium/hydrogen exchanger [Candidatus Nitrosotenuis uzonensis]